MAGPQHVVVEIRSTDLELLTVANAGLRSDDDACAAQVDPPAELDVVAVVGDRRVEPSEGPEEVGPHEQAGRREREHVADRVVLFLVVLARLGDRVDLPEAVESQTDVLEHGGVIPRHELRADDTGVGSVELLDEHPRAVGLERHVVMAEEKEPGVAFDQPQNLVRRCPEAGVGAEIAHERVWQAGGDPRLQGLAVTGAGEEEQGVEIGVVLGRERRERLVEPRVRRLGSVNDDDRDDRRRRRGVGFHQAVGASRRRPITGRLTSVRSSSVRSVRSLTVERGYRAAPMARRHASAIFMHQRLPDLRTVLAIVSRLRYVEDRSESPITPQESPVPTTPKFDLPKFDLPKFDLPKFDLPKFELADIDLPSAEQLVGCARNAAYVGVGLAVTTVERVQELQEQLLDALKASVEKVRPAA